MTCVSGIGQGRKGGQSSEIRTRAGRRSTHTEGFFVAWCVCMCACVRLCVCLFDLCACECNPWLCMHERACARARAPGGCHANVLSRGIRCCPCAWAVCVWAVCVRACVCVCAVCVFSHAVNLSLPLLRFGRRRWHECSREPMLCSCTKTAYWRLSTALPRPWMGLPTGWHHCTGTIPRVGNWGRVACGLLVPFAQLF